MDYYPQNTVAQYTTKLNSPIELAGDWEVGLTEISFPFSIENVVDRECYIKISHPEFDTYIKIPLYGRYYSEFQEVATALHREQMNIMLHIPSLDRVPVRFSFDENMDRVNMTIINDLSVIFSPALARLLGFRTMVKYCVSPFLAEHKMDFGSTVRSIYTYCAVSYTHLTLPTILRV